MKIFNILSIAILGLSLQSCLSPDEDPVQVSPVFGAIMAPKVGGAAEPNQIWIKLSDKTETSNVRTDWDFGFYNGDKYRVILNASIISAIGKIPNATDITKVKEADLSMLKDLVQVGTFDPANMQYIDNPNGNFLTQTSGIDEIKENNEDNPIYLYNMGREIYNGNIAVGSIVTGGDPRGWKKMQILRAPNGYKIRYADLNSTTYTEHIITKGEDYNFKFFNVKNGKEVNIQPKKKEWDIGFTVFTNEVFVRTGVSSGSYIFGDFVTTNTIDGVGAYQVTVPSGQSLAQAFNDFKMSNVDASKFIFNDQRAIGANWRTTTGTNGTTGASVYTNRFFVVKSANGFYFKLKFNSMMDKEGHRGYPNFNYDPL